jgi:2-oxoglutarate ferredoxin oxidoreductase subunit delta
MAKLEFYAEACKSCGYCVQVCPKNVLAIGHGVNKKGYRYVEAVNEQDCIGCAMCATICPDAVISVFK